MMSKTKAIICSLLMLVSMSSLAQNNNVIDEVIWIVGDEAILKSDVEGMRRDPDWSRIEGNPYCVIPERIAIQKLFLHQAAIDSLEASESTINQKVESQLNDWEMRAGSKEKLEEYMSMSYTQIREDLHDRLKDQILTEQMQSKLTEDIKINPAEVRRRFKDAPQDSLPLVPTQVEVELIVLQPIIPQTEIDRIKDKLRELSERITSGSTSFTAMAHAYSQDPSYIKGGEIGFCGKTDLDPAFAAAAFALNDTKKVSKVVESEFGFHIIQLIERRGDKGNFRHILIRPEVDPADIDTCINQLDSIAEDVRKGKLTFEKAATWASDDKDTRSNNGVLTNERKDDSGSPTFTSRFTMEELANVSSELARAVEGLQTGEISRPFQMVNKKGKTVCAIVKLKTRIKEHRANMQEDFPMLRDIVLAEKKSEVINNWIKEKQKSTYIRINDEWRSCDFQYPGWVK